MKPKTKQKKNSKESPKQDMKSSSQPPTFQEEILPLPLVCQRAVHLLQKMDQMTLLHEVLPSVLDLGVLNVEEWGGSFNYLFGVAHNVIFDDDGELNPLLHAPIVELQKSSSCGESPETLARALCRLAGIMVFYDMAVSNYYGDSLDA